MSSGHSVTGVPFSPDALPIRLTTREVCALLRISPRTLARRRAAGRISLRPVDRGAEDLYQTADVLRVLNLSSAPSPQPEAPPVTATWDSPDPETIARARARLGRRKGT